LHKQLIYYEFISNKGRVCWGRTRDKHQDREIIILLFKESWFLYSRQWRQWLTKSWPVCPPFTSSGAMYSMVPQKE